jgi:hypothetical protein
LLLLAIHLRQSFRDPPAGAVQDGIGHLQVALQPGRLCGGLRRRLPPRFQKQLRLGENALAHHARAFAPGGIELSGLPRIATMPGKSGRHPLAMIHADSGDRHQILHRHLRRDLSFAHLLLDGFWQELDEPQSPRYPAHAPIKAARQFFQRVAKALLHLRQQPALFERAFLLAESQRPVQQQSFGFAHRPYGRFHRVPAQLLQRRDALVPVDHHIAAAVVVREHDYDRCLLAAVSHRCHQPPLPVRLANSQVFPSPVQLVKLQSHRLFEVQYG